MSHHLDRAQLLLAQNRAADAEREAGQALLAEPENPRAHAIVALARLEQGEKERALEAARAAVGLAPDHAYFHYILGLILHRLDRDKDAQEVAEVAIRLDPSDAEPFLLLSSIHLARRSWSAALEAAEQALALDPEHVQAANLRAMALVRLGRKDEAMLTVDQALHRAPENAWSHANQGWNLLHKNQPRPAQDHFREALRLEPDLEYARQGMLEALKARNPVYRGLLAYFLWMGRQSTKLQWVFVIGTMFGGRLLRESAEKFSDYGWLLWPLVVLFYAFIYLSWVATPMFNLLLRLDRFGRHVLSRDERIATNWFAPFLLLALAALGWWALGAGLFAALLAAALAMLSVCVAATWAKPAGRSRQILGGATAVLGALAALTFVGPFFGYERLDMSLLLFFVGFLVFQFLANGLSSARS